MIFHSENLRRVYTLITDTWIKRIQTDLNKQTDKKFRDRHTTTNATQHNTNLFHHSILQPTYDHIATTTLPQLVIYYCYYYSTHRKSTLVHHTPYTIQHTPLRLPPTYPLSVKYVFRRLSLLYILLGALVVAIIIFNVLILSSSDSSSTVASPSLIKEEVPNTTLVVNLHYKPMLIKWIVRNILVKWWRN